MSEPRTNAGTLDRRVDLLSPHRTSADTGESVVSFVVSATVWAELLNEGGAQEGWNDAESRMRAPQRTRFRIRWRAGVDATWRVRWQGQDYEIRDVREATEGGANRGRQRWLVLTGEIVTPVPGGE